jgi:hypothetical protein
MHDVLFYISNYIFKSLEYLYIWGGMRESLSCECSKSVCLNICLTSRCDQLP